MPTLSQVRTLKQQGLQLQVQAFYTRFTKSNFFTDPCGEGRIWDGVPVPGHDSKIKELHLGIHIQNKDDMRYDTILILGYV